MSYSRPLLLGDAHVQATEGWAPWLRAPLGLPEHPCMDKDLDHLLWKRALKRQLQGDVKALVATYPNVLAELVDMKADIIDLKARIASICQLVSLTTSVEKRFKTLVKQWRAETGMLSSIAEKTMHPAYLQIISMGPMALPLVLKELRDRGGHWYYCLEALANVLGKPNPGLGDDSGDMARLKAVWLDWGEREGYLLPRGESECRSLQVNCARFPTLPSGSSPKLVKRPTAIIALRGQRGTGVVGGGLRRDAIGQKRHQGKKP